MTVDYQIFTVALPDLQQRRSMKWQTYPADVLPLWVAEMDAQPIPVVVDAVTDILRRGDTGYPAGPTYEQAWASFAERTWGWQPQPSAMLLAPDVMQAITVLLRAHCSPGDAVVINPPVYPPFYTAITDVHCQVLAVDLTEDGRLDLPALEAVFAGDRGVQPSAYLLCSPHNPTATVHTRAELETVARLARQHGVRVIADEIHSPLVQSGTEHVPYLSLPESAGDFAAASAAKGWNLASMKAALIMTGNPADLNQLPYLATRGAGSHTAVLAHSTAVRHVPHWPAQVMLEVAANQRLLTKLLAEHLPQVRYRPGPGTYLAWLDARATGLADPAQHWLAKARVALNGGSAFGPAYARWARLNLATSPAILTEAITRMASVTC